MTEELKMKLFKMKSSYWDSISILSFFIYQTLISSQNEGALEKAKSPKAHFFEPPIYTSQIS